MLSVPVISDDWGQGGPGFLYQPPGAASGACLSERHPAGRGLVGAWTGCLGAGLGCLVPSQPCLTLYARGQGFQVRPHSEHTGTSSVGQDPESISESSAPSTERDQIRGPRGKPPASYTADAIVLFCRSSLKVRTVLKIEMSELNIDAA